jgi:hypothetical protein
LYLYFVVDKESFGAYGLPPAPGSWVLMLSLLGEGRTSSDYSILKQSITQVPTAAR